MPYLIRAVAVTAAAAAAILAAPTTATADATIDATVDATADPSQASFESSTVDLSDDWGAARACAELGGTVECYRSETELLDAHPELAGPTSKTAAFTVDGGMVTASSSCSSSLRLYRSTGFTGSVLYLTTRLLAINLSTYGFDNDTSSYRVGGCAAAFYAGSNLSGAMYPGATGAWASASSMPTGWNDVVTSVIIF